jgi:hypothetical protein
LEELDVEDLFHPSYIKRYLIIFGIILFIIGFFLLIRKKLNEKRLKKEYENYELTVTVDHGFVLINNK